MNQHDYKRTAWNAPFIPQRADPYVLREGKEWFFTASVPEYDRIALRRAGSLEELRDAEEAVVWRAHEKGVMSKHIWAPELHRLDGRWYIYFAAGEVDDIWNIRPWVLECEGDDPLNDPWVERGMLRRADGDDFSFTDFSLDMTVFDHSGRRYCVWAEKVSVGRKISNLYIAEMGDPLTLRTPGAARVLGQRGPGVRRPWKSGLSDLFRQRHQPRLLHGPAMGGGWRRPDGHLCVAQVKSPRIDHRRSEGALRSRSQYLLYR